MDQSPRPPLVFNVVDYGALGNGVANSTTAILAAITAANVAGGQVWFPPGTFLSDQLALTGLTNVTIRGASEGSILQLRSNPSQNIQNITTWMLLTSCTGCVVDGLQFDLNNREHCAVGATGCTDITVSGNYIHNSPGTVGDNRPAIVMHSTVSAKVLNNYVYDVSTWISFGMSTSLGQITDSVLANNVFRNAKSTSSGNCTRSQIIGNVFDTSLYCGLELGGVGTAMVDWVVSGNTFKGGVAPCLQLAALASGGLTRDGTITGNIFDGSADAAFYAFGDIRDVVFSNNIIKDCVNGIVLTNSAAGGCKRFRIEGNIIYDTRSGGSRTMVKGIELAMGTSGGGALSGEVFADIDIVDNTIRNVTAAGITTSYTSGSGTWARCRISRNRVNDCDWGIKPGDGNPAGCWTAMEMKDNRCAGNVTGQIRVNIDPGDINTWHIADNFGALAYNSPYTIGSLGGVPAFFGLRSIATPESAIIAGVGSTCINTAGGVGTTFYVKQSGTSSTGWSPVNAVDFVDSSFRIIGSSDPTKTFGVEVDAQSTGAGLTLNTGAQTTSRSLTVPVLAGNDTIAALGVANRFTSTVALAAAALDADVSSAFGTPDLAIVINNATADSLVSIGIGANTSGAHIYGAKTRSTGSDANTAVQSGDELAAVGAYGADGAAYRQAALIRAAVDGAVSSAIVPGRWEFHTKNSAGTLVQAGLIDSAQLLAFLFGRFGDNLAAYNADVGNAFGTPKLAVSGNNSVADAIVALSYGANAVGAHIYGAKTRSSSSTCDANTAVQSGDEMIAFSAYGASPNADYRAAGIWKCVVDAAPSGTIVPGAWEAYVRDTSGNMAIALRIANTSATSVGIIGSSFPGNVIAGVQTGAAASAGQVGEVLSSVVSSYTNYTTTVTYQAITSLVLTRGDWVLEAMFTYDVNGATITAGGNAIFVISTTSASAAGATEGLDIVYIDQNLVTGDRHSGCIVGKQINISSDTTYYLNSQAAFTLGNPRFVGSLLARRLR